MPRVRRMMGARGGEDEAKCDGRVASEGMGGMEGGDGGLGSVGGSGGDVSGGGVGAGEGAIIFNTMNK